MTSDKGLLAKGIQKYIEFSDALRAVGDKNSTARALVILMNSFGEKGFKSSIKEYVLKELGIRKAIDIPSENKYNAYHILAIAISIAYLKTKK
ncbi:hypothetical protein Igag_0614 [Ignisphaera aggregans DSM 17230]|uniref:Uncharacterized protein n=1 Tax=Ignisphaera aggregans (strain DSM 17230 / JCM 13409 / AQ1.S1) TaxID=583356 RepID=E0SSH6_IGNAA|nr:hypothetical protein Igag_0614 [Ignisphaera aggregans DSM 17230]